MPSLTFRTAGISVPMIAGIVLAAGRSRRMGQPKAFLRAAHGSFLETAVRALREGGCAEVVVVTGPEADEVAGAIAAEARRLGARVAVNPSPDSEQVDSLRAGIRALGDDVEAAVVAPVDVPGASPALVAELIAAFVRTRAPIAAPAHDGRHGHPVLFSRGVFPELLGPLPHGARSVVHAHAGEIAEVPVDALPADVDTPADYRRWRGDA